MYSIDMLKEYALKEEDLNFIQTNMLKIGACKRISDFFYVFSDPTRISIIAALSMSELCVSDLCDILLLNQTTVSHQLKILRDASIVDYRRCGKILFYGIINPYINDVITTGVKQLEMENGVYNN